MVRPSDLTEKAINLNEKNVILEEGTGGSSSQLENSLQKQSRGGINKEQSF